jgi:ATP-dependent Lhr-like helicase
MPGSDPLALFLPPVAQWFRDALGSPTPVQEQGWPVIASGQNTLLLAPTGSGKTLAAFLACLDNLWRQDPLAGGVQILYISPLKALNNDIYRNLQLPLAGVARRAEEMNFPLPRLDMAIRTGDTSTSERQRLVRKPPHILITTPESLHLLLTSKARETLRGVRHCIVDEIHALCPNKRGVFLSLLLERLEELNPRSFVRIGLSATQRPLEEVARFLGGGTQDQQGNYAPRPVTIVDAGIRKNLDLKVISPVEQFGPLPEKSIWPPIFRLLADLIAQHRSTIVFANNRRSVERITNQLNEILQEGEGDLPVRAHHGSVSLEVRQQTEQALKDGRLRAVVATASLELGIDMGAVDLVCQVESPGNVSRGLQRVGRAGHLVGQQSKGRLIPKTLADLLNEAVLAAEMAAGRVEEMQVPANCLDVLAQQVVAMVAMDDWAVPALFTLLRRAYPFRDLSPRAFDAVLQMVTGRYAFAVPHQKPSKQLSAFHPRISWDRVHDRLLALPGSQRLALVNGGTIPDTGQYAVYTLQGLRLGELDEEFIYERRVGETFLLGTSAWRIDSIQTDRVLVVPVEGTPAMVPFWRGERAGRTYDLGLAQGRFLRTLAERLDTSDCLDWLEREYFLDRPAARNIRDFVRRQVLRTGFLPTDRTLVIEASRDPLGDWQVLLLSPLGSRLHLTLRLAVENVLHRRLGYRVQCLHHDDGILFRLADTEEPILDLLAGITPENIRDLVLEELADSALFALRFRQNAARALLMPRGGGGQRAPLWLQRLRGKDLLQVARQHPDFPIVVETFRECLHDHLDVDHAQQLLQDIGTGAIQVLTSRLEAPSPFAASVLFNFTVGFMYEYDEVEGEPGRGFAQLDQNLLDQLVGQNKELALDRRAVHRVDHRLRGVGQPPRSTTELAEWLRKLGDLSASDLSGNMESMLADLEGQGIVQRLNLPGVPEPLRWVLTEEAAAYERVFGATPVSFEEVQEEAATILYRFLETHALVSLRDVLERYSFEATWAKRKLEEWGRSGRLIPVQSPQEPEPLQWSAPENFADMQRGTLAILRREVITCPPAQFVDFVLRWQHLHPETRLAGAEGLVDVLTRLNALAIPALLWEQTVLPGRLREYQPRWLDDTIASGQWTWFCWPTDALELAFLDRENLGQLALPSSDFNLDVLAERVLENLRAGGAQFLLDLAQAVAANPSSNVRAALWNLARQGLVSNDHFDVVRRGEEAPLEVIQEPLARAVSPRGLTRGRNLRNRVNMRPEGRWFLLPWGHPEKEEQVFFQARLLLQRYGVVSRELASLDPALPPWRVLYEVLSRLEMAGEVRRGYFVEGLSGAQFALPAAARQLQDLSLPAQAQAPVVLVHSLDPANLYGSGAPLPWPDESRTVVRRPGTWLVLKAGQPILLIEQQGKRLTSLPGTRRDDLAQAVRCLPALLPRSSLQSLRHKLTVEQWNDQPVTTTEGRELLEAAGFVRDYQAMTLYAVWR